MNDMYRWFSREIRDESSKSGKNSLPLRKAKSCWRKSKTETKEDRTSEYQDEIVSLLIAAQRSSKLFIPFP